MTIDITLLRAFCFALGASILAAGCSFAAGSTSAPETPIITPAGGSFKPPLEVGINSFTLGATIRYTLDGSAPKSSSPVLPAGSLLKLTSSKTISAVAIDAIGQVSDVAVAEFAISGVRTTDKPVLTPADTSATGPVTVSIATSTPGAALYYTTDGSNPSRASKRYRAPIKVNGPSVILRAIAYGAGRPASSIAQALYHTGLQEQVKQPTIDPGGMRFEGWTKVTIASSTPNSIVRYTVDGSEPSAKSTLYSGSKTICVTTTLKARAFVASMADSPVATAKFEADAKSPVVLDVSKYGAFPSNPDNTAAVESALHDAQNAWEGSTAPKRVKIVFPTGVYNFLHGLSLNNANNVEIDGQGSTFVYHKGSGYTGFTIGEYGACANITVRNIMVDADPLPDIPGKVVNSTGASFDFVVDPGYEPVVQRYGAILEFDPITRNPKSRGIDIYYGVGLTPTLVDARTLHFNLPYGKVKDGMYLNMRCTAAGHTFVFGHIDGLTLQNIRLYAGYSFAFVPHFCENVILDRVVVMRKPGRAALSSNEADDVHFNCCKGTIEVKDCDFESQGDDCINLAGGYAIVSAVDGNKVSIISPNVPSRAPSIKTGEVIEILGGQTMLQTATALVTDATTTSRTADAPATEILTLDKAPTGVAVGSDLLDSLTWLPRTTVERCNFIGNRARGILVQFPDTLVQNCSFINVSGSGLHVSTVAKIWYEGTRTTDVVVRNNSFSNCNYLWKTSDGTIHVYADNQSQTSGAAGTHARLTVEDNTIRDTDHPALTLSALDDADIIGNVFDNCDRAPDDQTDRSNCVVSMRNASRLRLHDNTISPPKAKAIWVDPNTTSDIDINS